MGRLDSCVYTSKLGHPHVAVVQIVGQEDWFTAPMQIVVLGCDVLLALLAWVLWFLYVSVISFAGMMWIAAGGGGIAVVSIASNETISK